MKIEDFDQKKCADFSINGEFNACHYYDPAATDSECGFCKDNTKYYRCLADTKRCIPVSYSSINNFLTCHNLYYLQDIRGIRVHDHATSIALKDGQLWDSVLQKHLGGIDKFTKQPISIPDVINQYQIPSKEVAAIRGLYRAYKMLEIQVEPSGELQAKVDHKIDFQKVWGKGMSVELLVTGYYDRKYPNYFVENKLSGSPDRYLDPYFIQSQVGVYFLADPTLEYCIMEVTRRPALKSSGQFKGEEDDEYGERIYQDAITRPSHYFIGFDPKTRRYGKKYFRSEFNLEELNSRFIHVFRELFEARCFDGWYKNDRVCNNVLPGFSCDMLNMCRINNKFNSDIYYIRQRKITF